MASAERIAQDIATIGKATAKLAAELHQTYAEYLQALGQALRQQLVLSGYHVCTQGYPTQFLTLSLSQRQALQQGLKQLATQAQTALISLLHSPDSQLVEPELDLQELEGDGEAQAGGEIETMELTQSLSIESPPTESQSTELLPIESLPTELTPVQLMEWQEALETAIAREFQVASFKANRLLHQAAILPNQLPNFLKATGKIDAAQVEAISQNMMDLLMEAQSNSEPSDEESDVMQMPIVIQLVAVHLQLSDVEFADATSSSYRNRLRSLTARLKTLRQTFRKKERELAIAQAEAAWRSSWFED